MHRVCIFTSVGAVILASLALAPARAANTPVVEAESLARTPYQSVTAVCINTSEAACPVTFTTVPANKKLVVVNVSCGWSLVHPSQIATVELTTTNGSYPPLHYLPVQYTANFNKSSTILLDNFIFDIQTSAVYAAGQTPEVLITNNGAVTWGGGFCSLTGYFAR
jgi:hypothetical protein